MLPSAQALIMSVFVMTDLRCTGSNLFGLRSVSYAPVQAYAQDAQHQSFHLAYSHDACHKTCNVTYKLYSLKAKPFNANL